MIIKNAKIKMRKIFYDFTNLIVIEKSIKYDDYYFILIILIDTFLI